MTPTESKPPIFHQLDRCNPAPYSAGEYLRRALWLAVEATLFRIPLPRGYGWRNIWLRMFGARIGHHSGVHRTTRVRNPWLLELGNHTIIGERVHVYNLGKITIGHHSVVSQETYLCAGTHDYADHTFRLLRTPVTIGDDVWVGADAFIGPGVNVGSLSVVGARSSTYKDLPEHQVCVGNPAKPIKERVLR